MVEAGAALTASKGDRHQEWPAQLILLLIIDENEKMRDKGLNTAIANFL